LQVIPYSFVAEGPADANPPGNLVVPLGNYGLALQALAISPDSNTIWVSASANIDRVSSGGTILQTYAVPAGTSISGMAAISDGSVWYTDSGHNAIVNLSGNGTFTTYPVPTASSGVDRITVGGDGALWFTENSAGKIGRITPQGTIHEYRVPTPNAAPAGISGPIGPSCNPDVIWFVEQNAGKIGEITIQ
jgi:virginiamycin B lyase